MSVELSRPETTFPYQEEVEELVQEMNWAETRVEPIKTRKYRERHLNYGWKAVLYENDENLFRKAQEKFLSLLDNTDYRVEKPDYVWKLEAPNGQIYREKGINIKPETFEEEINRFLED
ncbi:MAG: hypothetical protein ABEJ87_03750 [Candidatus Nanohalobium sp.]